MEILNIKDELRFHRIKLANLNEELSNAFIKFLDMYLKDVSEKGLDHFCALPSYPMLNKTYKGKHWWEYTNVPKELIDYKISLENHIECIENLMSIDAQNKIGIMCDEKATEKFIEQLKERFDNSYSIKFKMDDIPLEDVIKK